MSTKALREVLAYMKQHHGEGTMEDAATELEAIEKAAKVINENVKVPAIPADLEPALCLMESIAKEAP